MSDRRIPPSINPQMAMKSYLDDLLQEVSHAISPLEELNASEAVATPVVEPERPVGHRQMSLARARLSKKAELTSLPVREPLNLTSPLFLPTPSFLTHVETVKPEEALAAEQAVEIPETLEEVRVEIVNELTEPKAAAEEMTPLAQTIPVEDSRRAALRQRMLALRAKIKDDRAKAKVLEKTQSQSDDSNTTEQAKSAVEPAKDERVSASHDAALSSSEAPQVAPPGAWQDNGRPAWAQDRFDCLLFSVAGLKLAVPLVSLGAIHALDRELTPLVGRPSWFLGLLPLAGRNIRAVDTAQWVMPERYQRDLNEAYRFIIRLGDSDWGIACDRVAQSFSLKPDEVKWRTERSKRPWLAGTVVEHMCALMDVDALSYLLDQAERTKASPLGKH